MLRSALCIAIFGLLPAQPAAAVQVVTILADDNYPPYSYAWQGQSVGIYNTILRVASARLPDYQIELKPVPYKRGLAELESGRSLALSPPYYRPRERPYIGLYSVPILKEQVAAFCRPAAIKKAHPQWPDDYRGLRFGNNPGFRLGGAAFWTYVARGDIQVEEAADARSNLLKLLHGRIDCYLNDKLAIDFELARLEHQGDYLPESGHALFQSGPISEEAGHVGLTNRDRGRFPYKADFLRQLNAALEDMQRNGTIDRIVAAALRAAARGSAP
nr:transporter substrate-binding domain-containing protein [Chromobacterium sp. ASV5]